MLSHQANMLAWFTTAAHHHHQQLLLWRVAKTIQSSLGHAQAPLAHVSHTSHSHAHACVMHSSATSSTGPSKGTPPHAQPLYLQHVGHQSLRQWQLSPSILMGVRWYSNSSDNQSPSNVTPPGVYSTFEQHQGQPASRFQTPKPSPPSPPQPSYSPAPYIPVSAPARLANHLSSTSTLPSPPSVPQPWYDGAPLSGAEQLLLRHASSCSMSDLLSYLRGSLSSTQAHHRHDANTQEARRSPGFWQQLAHALPTSEALTSATQEDLHKLYRFLEESNIQEPELWRVVLPHLASAHLPVRQVIWLLERAEHVGLGLDDAAYCHLASRAIHVLQEQEYHQDDGQRFQRPSSPDTSVLVHWSLRVALESAASPAPSTAPGMSSLASLLHKQVQEELLAWLYDNPQAIGGPREVASLSKLILQAWEGSVAGAAQSATDSSGDGRNLGDAGNNREMQNMLQGAGACIERAVHSWYDEPKWHNARQCVLSEQDVSNIAHLVRLHWSQKQSREGEEHATTEQQPEQQQHLGVQMRGEVFSVVCGAARRAASQGPFTSRSAEQAGDTRVAISRLHSIADLITHLVCLEQLIMPAQDCIAEPRTGRPGSQPTAHSSSLTLNNALVHLANRGSDIVNKVLHQGHPTSTTAGQEMAAAVTAVVKALTAAKHLNAGLAAAARELAGHSLVPLVPGIRLLRHVRAMMPATAERRLSRDAAVRLLQEHNEQHGFGGMQAAELQQLSNDAHALRIGLPGPLVTAMMEKKAMAQHPPKLALQQQQQQQQQGGEQQEQGSSMAVTHQQADPQLTAFVAQKHPRLSAEHTGDATAESESAQATCSTEVTAPEPEPAGGAPTVAQPGAQAHTKLLMGALRGMLAHARQPSQQEPTSGPSPGSDSKQPAESGLSPVQLLAQLSLAAPKMCKADLAAAIHDVARMYKILGQKQPAVEHLQLPSGAAAAAAAGGAQPGGAPAQEGQGSADAAPGALHVAVHSFLAKAEQVMLRNAFTEDQAWVRSPRKKQAKATGSPSELAGVGSRLAPRSAKRVALAVKHMTEAGFRCGQLGCMLQGCLLSGTFQYLTPVSAVVALKGLTALYGSQAYALSNVVPSVLDAVRGRTDKTIVRTLAETLRRLGADKEADELKAQHKQQFVANAKKTRKPAMNRTVSVKGF